MKHNRTVILCTVKESLPAIIESLSLLSGLLSYPLLMAFSRKTRNAIADRANGIDEVTGQPLHQMEGAHLNHNKFSEEYDTPENGLGVNAITHAWMHLLDEDNGLNGGQNKWATRQILKRATTTSAEDDLFGRWFKLK